MCITRRPRLTRAPARDTHEGPMTHDEARAKLREILMTDFKVPEAKITDDATFRGAFGMDSLDAVDFIYLCTKSFGLKADVSAFRELHTFKLVVDFVVAESEKQRAAGGG